MSRQLDTIAGRKLLQTQLENYRATRDQCREPQRSIFSALITQLEQELQKWPLGAEMAAADQAHVHAGQHLA